MLRYLSPRSRSPVGGEAGQVNLVSVAVLAIVVVSLGGASILLARTLGAARSINAKADRIAKTGRGINIATDSVVQLNRTNDTAGSILNTAQPLEGKLDRIVGLAQSIDRLGASILGSARKINGTAVEINGTATKVGATARGINTVAAEILDVGRRIDRDVRLINENLDVTISIARSIKSDTGNIVVEARKAHQNAACIDRKVGGTHGNDGHCS